MSPPATMPDNTNKTNTFNPFEDRLSRDIRNDLSESIIEVLSSRSLDAAEEAAAYYRQTDLPMAHAGYIEQRLQRYAEALSRLAPDSDLLCQAAVLWDLALFFEVHEILEPAWIEATGGRKRLLQALIRAAGVYINLELGYFQRAEKIASKALPVLEELGDSLTSVMHIDNLIEALQTLPDKAPRLSRN
ncbi:MAG: DUF309 domain-containing protein [Desulfocapsaceae bacterium]